MQRFCAYFSEIIFLHFSQCIAFVLDFWLLLKHYTHASNMAFHFSNLSFL